MRLSKLAGIALLSATLSTSAFAGTITFYTDKSGFDAAKPASMLVEDFQDAKSGFAQIGTPAGATQQPINATNDNAGFAPGAIIPNLNLWLTADNTNTLIGWYVMTQNSNTYLMTANYGLRITFDAPVQWFGMDIVGSSSAGNIIAKSNGSEVGQAAYSSPGFIGFNSTTGITSIEFSNTWVDFDNITINSVNASEAAATPEPASFLLGGMGLAGLYVARRKRKA